MTRLQKFVTTCALMTIVVPGCTQGVDRSGQVDEVDAFALPAGDAALGQATFVEMRCYDCHSIPGVDLPVGEEHDQVRVALGGEVAKAATYNELVTSIINPSHRLSPAYAEALVARNGVSNMTNYNGVMTVSELINLVAFLQTKYKAIESSPAADYPIYQ